MTDLIARGVCLSQSLKDQGKSRTPKSMTLKVKTSRNPLKIRASLGLVAVSSSSRALGRNPLKIRASLGQKAKEMNAKGHSRNPLKIRASLGPKCCSVTTSRVSRNPLKIRASLGLWTAWHSHVDSRFHCANIRHKREEKVAGPKLIHIKSLLAF